MTDPRFEPLIQEIIENFDFKKVRKAMKALNWEWWNAGKDEFGNTVAAVPKKPQLRAAALENLKEVGETAMRRLDRQATIGAGGFVAHCDLTDPDEPYFSLVFQIADWEAP